MEYLVTFELLNVDLSSAFRLISPLRGRYPQIVEISIFPYRDGSKVISEIQGDNQPRKTGTLVCLTEAPSPRDAVSLARKAADPLCVLLEIAQRRDVWYWGASVYHRIERNWSRDSEEWGLPLAENCRGFLSNLIPRQHLETFAKVSLSQMDRPEFPIEDFMTSTFFLQESYRRSSIIEPMFIDAWIGFELLVNELALRINHDMIMSPSNFRKVSRKLRKWIEENLTEAIQLEALSKMLDKLAELNRVPLKQLISDLLVKYQVKFEFEKAMKLKELRDELFHTGKQGDNPDIPNIESAMSMQRLLEATLLGMLGATDVGTAPWSGGPEPDWEYPGVDRNESNAYSTSFVGTVKNAGGTVLFDGNMKVDWNPRKMVVSGVTEDRSIMIAGANGASCEIVGLSREGKTVSVEGAFTSFYKHPNFEMTGLRVTSVSGDHPAPSESC